MKICLDGNDITGQLSSCVNKLDGTSLNFTGWGVKNVNQMIMGPGQHTLQLSIYKSASSRWSALYSEDDRGIKLDSLEQSRTFALKYLIGGFKEGLENTEPILFKTSITFEK